MEKYRWQLSDIWVYWINGPIHYPLDPGWMLYFLFNEQRNAFMPFDINRIYTSLAIPVP